MSVLADYKLLWKAAYVQRNHPAVVPLMKLLAGLVALIGVCVGVIQHEWTIAVRIGLGIPMLLMLLVWTMVVTPVLALMNTPANARLVPRLRRRMVEMTAAGWVLAAAFCLLTPFWPATPVIVLWVMSMAGGRSGSRIASAMVVVAALWSPIVNSLPEPVITFATSVPGTFVFCVMVALFGAWTIRTVLPHGGDKHFSQRKRQVEIIERFQSMGRKHAPAGRERRANLYGWALRRAIKGRHPGSLMLLGLGPNTHWTAMLPICGMILVAGFGAHLLFGFSGGEESSVGGWVLLLTLVTIVQLGFFSYWKGLMAKARNEAALLLIAPLYPGARNWKSSVGGVLVRNALALCSMVTLTTVLLALLDGARIDELISLAALSCTLVMPGIAWMLRNYSRDYISKQLSLFGLLIRVFPAALILLAGLVGMLGLQMKIGALAWVLLAAASNVIGALAAAYYWRVAMAAPAGFPEQRIA
jgi:hypothetical protein